MFTVATATWMVYLSAFLAFYSSNSIIRCMITKSVGPDEVGKVLSFVGAIQVGTTFTNRMLFE